MVSAPVLWAGMECCARRLRARLRHEHGSSRGTLARRGSISVAVKIGVEQPVTEPCVERLELRDVGGAISWLGCNVCGNRLTSLLLFLERVPAKSLLPLSVRARKAGLFGSVKSSMGPKSNTGAVDKSKFGKSPPAGDTTDASNSSSSADVVFGVNVDDPGGATRVANISEYDGENDGFAVWLRSDMGIGKPAPDGVIDGTAIVSSN